MLILTGIKVSKISSQSLYIKFPKLSKLMQFPTNFSWVPNLNCSCPVVDNDCYRPEHYTKPIICVHKSIANISSILEQPVGQPTPISSIKWVYFLLFAIITIQVFS